MEARVRREEEEKSEDEYALPCVPLQVLAVSGARLDQHLEGRCEVK